jgi:hypothetical protein
MGWPYLPKLTVGAVEMDFSFSTVNEGLAW